MQVVNALWDGMQRRDTAAIRSLFSGEARLMRVDPRSGEISVTSVSQFIGSIGRADRALIETIRDWEVRVDDNLASVWTPYSFHFGDACVEDGRVDTSAEGCRFSHCGVDAFQLLKGPGGWKIVQVADTFRRDGCESRD